MCLGSCNQSLFFPTGQRLRLLVPSLGPSRFFSFHLSIVNTYYYGNCAAPSALGGHPAFAHLLCISCSSGCGPSHIVGSDLQLSSSRFDTIVFEHRCRHSRAACHRVRKRRAQRPCVCAQRRGYRRLFPAICRHQHHLLHFRPKQSKCVQFYDPTERQRAQRVATTVHQRLLRRFQFNTAHSTNYVQRPHRCFIKHDVINLDRPHFSPC